jgi:hypothetical protein
MDFLIYAGVFIAGAIFANWQNQKVIARLRTINATANKELDKAIQQVATIAAAAEKVEQDANIWRDKVSLYYFEEYKKQRIEYSLALAVSLGVHNMAKNGTPKEEALRVISTDIYLTEKQTLCENNAALYASIEDSKVFTDALRMSETMWRTGEVQYHATPMTIQ